MIVKTGKLDQAAFYTTLGGSLEKIEGKYPNNVFHIKTSPLISWYEKIGGFVPYNHYANERKRIKLKSRIQSGLPAHFTGDTRSHFKLLDLATYRPWKHHD